MRKAAFVFFFLVLVAAAVFMVIGNPLSILDGQNQNSPSKVDVGFVLLDQPEGSDRVSFDAATTNIQLTGFDGEAPNPARTAEEVAETTFIHMIRGHDLDETGNATSWNFVVRQPEQVSLVSYDRFGEKIGRWDAQYPNTTINISEIMAPGALFAKNYQTIFPTSEEIVTEKRDLALAEGTYYLTITGRTETKNMMFDAYTGTLIQSND
ncbi:MAG: hypothetical protein M0Q92_14610 [Methanoregula sp.]|jgi:hypothetical protein|nr:hypothetical protein [Methanoregula sp.]PKL65663.1 MAG: hypothetical protein CVV32_00195 [Methanomicrobiales archaeon HGW-Methanomicrobiales-3]